MEALLWQFWDKRLCSVSIAAARLARLPSLLLVGVNNQMRLQGAPTQSQSYLPISAREGSMQQACHRAILQVLGKTYEGCQKAPQGGRNQEEC